MLVTDFDFFLPPELIAQHPLPERDASRLLHLDRSTQSRTSTLFSELPKLLNPGDLLVFNDSRVVPARLRGRKPETGGAVEILLLDEVAPRDWWVMLRPGKRVRPGTKLHFGPLGATLEAEVADRNTEGHCRLRFSGDVLAFAEAHGEIPLPPYIRREPGTADPEDRARYQTVYAREPGSVAAPTAGLHFTPRLLQQLEASGVRTARLTLHVGAGTFLPVKAERVEDHVMHEERFSLPATTVDAIEQAKAAGRRVIAVGTTTARVLESVARGQRDGLWGEPADSEVVPHYRTLPPVESGRTRIFLRPPCRFRVLDGLITNFHLPQSTLLMLVSAFAAPGEPVAGRDWMLESYRAAVAERFRFFSYGDAMLIA